jgi:hypothetical protein
MSVENLKAALPSTIEFRLFGCQPGEAHLVVGLDFQ